MKAAIIEIWPMTREIWKILRDVGRPSMASKIVISSPTRLELNIVIHIGLSGCSVKRESRADELFGELVPVPPKVGKSPRAGKSRLQNPRFVDGFPPGFPFPDLRRIGRL